MKKEFNLIWSEDKIWNIKFKMRNGLWRIHYNLETDKENFLFNPLEVNSYEEGVMDIFKLTCKLNDEY